MQISISHFFVSFRSEGPCVAHQHWGRARAYSSSYQFYIWDSKQPCSRSSRAPRIYNIHHFHSSQMPNKETLDSVIFWHVCVSFLAHVCMFFLLVHLSYRIFPSMKKSYDSFWLPGLSLVCFTFFYLTNHNWMVTKIRNMSFKF